MEILHSEGGESSPTVVIVCIPDSVDRVDTGPSADKGEGEEGFDVFVIVQIRHHLGGKLSGIAFPALITKVL
jgi:hypothetical protein